jgi:hypothetical protein
MDAQTALTNLEATAFNLLLVANNIGAKLADEPLGRVLCNEAGRTLTALFEWRRLRVRRFETEAADNRCSDGMDQRCASDQGLVGWPVLGQGSFPLRPRCRMCAC